MGSSLLLLAPLGSVLVLIFAGYLAYTVMKQSEGAGRVGKITGPMALFVHFDGSIFTKAASVGRELAGKVGVGILKNDRGNSAVMADRTVAKTGDAAVMSSDLYESHEGFIISAGVLAVAAGLSGNDTVIPFAMAAIVELLISIMGILFFRSGEQAEPKVLSGALPEVVWTGGILIAVVSFFLFNIVPGSEPAGEYFAILRGLAAGILVGFYISNTYNSKQWLADMPLLGPETEIAGGISPGRLLIAIPGITVGVVVLAGYCLAGESGDLETGLYSIRAFAIGMLGTLGLIPAADAWEPAAGNAEGTAGISCMESGAGKYGGALDSHGNNASAGDHAGKLGWCTG